MHSRSTRRHRLTLLMVIMLAVSTLFPIETLAKKIPTPIAKENWKVSLNGGALFEPIVQKDGSLLVGSYQKIDGKYKAEILSLSRTGKKSGKWKLTAEKIELGGTLTAPTILALNYSKGKITGYNPKGQKLWTHNIGQELQDHEVDEKGNIYAKSTKGTLYKISTKGKQQFKLEAGEGEFHIFSGTVYHLHSSGINTTVTMYTSKGKVKYKIYPLAEEDNEVNLVNVSLIGSGNHAFMKATYWDGATEDIYHILSAFDENGKRIRTVKMGGELVNKVFEYKNDSIFLDTRYYYKMNAKGKLIKKTKMPSMDDTTIQHAMMTDNGEVYVERGKKLFKFNANGSIAWYKSISGSLMNGLVMNGKIYVNNYNAEGKRDRTDGYVTVLDSKGNVISKISVARHIFGEYGETFITGDLKRKTIYVTNHRFDYKKDDFSKMVITSVKQ
ncbi:hypothetical protein ACIQXR_05350 [Peribacillus sp. NPDC097224]|uniref:hypothetical protein n=1 Tax=Peribacillus sp. NPDC097224 TaxID=3364399 RepID=UPI003806FA1D